MKNSVRESVVTRGATTKSWRTFEKLRFRIKMLMDFGLNLGESIMVAPSRRFPRTPSMYRSPVKITRTKKSTSKCKYQQTPSSKVSAKKSQ